MQSENLWRLLVMLEQCHSEAMPGLTLNDKCKSTNGNIQKLIVLNINTK